MTQQRYPRGHFIGSSIAPGMILGIPIGYTLGNIALGTAVGAAIGVVVGIVLEKKNNPNPRPLTKKEKTTRERNVFILVVVGIIAYLVVSNIR